MNLYIILPQSFGMLHIEYLLPILSFWHTIAAEIQKHKQHAGLSNNMVSAIHCSLYLLQYYYVRNDKLAMNYTIHVSVGFYIYDLLYFLRFIYNAIITRQKPSHIHFVYVFHHILAIYLLTDIIVSKYTDILLCCYYLIELSNLTLYVSYHIRKEYPTHKPVIILFDIFHLLWYSYFRVIQTSVLFYDNIASFLEYHFAGQCGLVTIHMMGVAWTLILAKNTIAKCLSM
jgi:hypothetical protein